MIRLTIIFLFTSLVCQLDAQNFEQFYPEIFRGGELLTNAGVEGIRSGQFSDIDLDGDGKQDLFIYDKAGDRVYTFLNDGDTGEISYNYAPGFESLFPPLDEFALLVDFNGDGIEDLFTYTFDLDGSGVAVWRGRRDGSGLFYERMIFENGPFGGTTADILKFPQGGNLANVYSAITDVPGLSDVDGDGDIDVLSFEPEGLSLYYYQNMAIENGFGLDTFDLRLADLCFGKFLESMFSSDVILSDNPDRCATGFQNDNSGSSRHAGSTVTIFDNNCDGNVDLLIGDLLSNRLVALFNSTDDKDLMVDQDGAFPSYDESVDLEVFNAAYLFDANNDGLDDMVVTPNAELDGQNFDHIWLYLNKGTACAPEYELETKNFIIDNTLSLGGGTAPTILDYNNDGLSDILVGSSGLRLPLGEIEKRMYLFENVGTENVPAFDLVDEDYLSFSEINDNLIRRLSPDVGDLDSDGDEDIIIGTNQGLFFYLENTAGPNNPAAYADYIYPYADIFVGQNARPIIYDWNGDGLNDIISGESNNQMSLLVNQGTVGSPFFDAFPAAAPNTETLGNIFSGNDPAKRNGAPEIISTKDGLRFVVGFSSGKVFYYDGLDKDTFTLITDNLGDFGGFRNPETKFTNLDDDDNFEMILGTENGGLSFWNTDITIKKSPNSINYELTESYSLYPSIVRNQLTISFEEDVKGLFSVVSGDGRVLSNGPLRRTTNISIDERLPSGLYFIHLVTSSGSKTEKFIKI